MIKLLRIELRKIAPNRTFWILLGLYIVVLGAVLISFQSFIDTITSQAGAKSPVPIPNLSIYTFPAIWHNLTFISGYFKIVLGILILIMITNEYSFKTIRQNVISGLSRLDFLKAKILLVALISIFSTLFVFILGLILGLINSSVVGFEEIFSKTVFLFALCLETFSYLCFALMVGILVKRSGIAIGILMLYSFVAEPIINYYLPYDIDDYMPLKAIRSLIDIPNTSLMRLFGVEFQGYIALPDALLVSGYTILFMAISYWVLKKRNL